MIEVVFRLTPRAMCLEAGAGNTYQADVCEDRWKERRTLGGIDVKANHVEI
jgi:hypothetical protein